MFDIGIEVLVAKEQRNFVLNAEYRNPVINRPAHGDSFLSEFSVVICTDNS